MKNANYARVVSFLARNGVTDAGTVEQVAGGFDLNQPVYEQMVEPGDRLFQFIRNTAVGRPVPVTGNWFCIAGATMDSLAIFSGGAGRSLVEFGVTYPVMSLEGTASPKARNWNWDGGGRGGGTQIYLPKQSLFALVGKGTHLPGNP